MMVRYLRAEELVRLAGVAKSTVLAAIRRGEIASSRTVGRGTRISVATARAYLESRGCPIPNELREPRSSTIAVVTERADTVEQVRGAARASWTVTGGTEPYATLLWIGAHAPAIVVVDLGMALVPPFEVIRAVRASDLPADTRVLALGYGEEILAAARAVGASDGVRARNDEALARALCHEGPSEQRLDLS
jgi:excisionase family DNA binding protein